MNLLFGNASKKAIMVPQKILMSGYIERVNENVGVHDELFTRCVTLYDGKTKIVIISNDLLEIDKEITLNVRTAIKEKLAIPFENVMICSTHTHSGPVITAWDLSVKDYLKKNDIKSLKLEITQTIIDNAFICASNLKPVNIGFAKSECIGVAGNRVVKNNISDFSVNAIQVTDKSNGVLAVIVNYTCHPTILGADNLLISGDFPGLMSKRLEKHFIDSTALFINGACGNQSTRFTRRGQDFEEAERMGKLLFDSVINALTQVQSSNEGIAIKTKMDNITFPQKKFPPREELICNLASAESIKNNAVENNLSSGEKRLAVTKYQGALIALRISEVLDKLGDINSQIQIFKIGNIEIVGVPVELFVEFGIEIKGKSISPNTIIAGYANEVLGYVYTKDALENGGYEVYASPFSVETGEFIVSKVLEMERALF